MTDKDRKPSILTPEEAATVREIIAASKWKGTTSAAYKDCPHSYIIAHNCGPEWKRFSDIIRAKGDYRMWRGYRFKYLEVDGEIFWVDFPALNRAPAGSLDNGGYPPRRK